MKYFDPYDGGEDSRQHRFSREPALFYDPPYSDDLADEVAWQLVRHLDGACGLQHRAVVLTPHDCYRVDFLIERAEPAPRRVALCYTPPEELEWPQHDALVVGSRAVEVLYRVQRSVLPHRLHDLLFLMARWDPDLFRDGARGTLRQKASVAARQVQTRPHDSRVHLSYPSTPVDVLPDALPVRPRGAESMVVHRFSQQQPSVWKGLFERAALPRRGTAGSRRRATGS